MIGFNSRYISTAESAEKPDNKRVLISNEAFAIGEMIEELINKIEHARLSLK